MGGFNKTFEKNRVSLKLGKNNTHVREHLRTFMPTLVTKVTFLPSIVFENNQYHSASFPYTIYIMPTQVKKKSNHNI